MFNAVAQYPNLPGAYPRPGVDIPTGPWGPIYRTAPGASLPSQTSLQLQGGGFGAPVKFVGGLRDASMLSANILPLLGSALFAGAVGAGVGWSTHSRHPKRNTALVMGGAALAGGLVSLLLMPSLGV
jgi:hypothetical protein